MEVRLTADQRAFARQAIETGRLHGEEEVVQEALGLWETRERIRAELLVAVDAAEASLARGEGRGITEQSMRDLADNVKRRGRARLASERTASVWWRTGSLSKQRLNWTKSGSTSLKRVAIPPHIGRRRDEDLRPGIRSFPVGEYIVLYRFEEDDVLMLRVIRGSRDIEMMLGF